MHNIYGHFHQSDRFLTRYDLLCFEGLVRALRLYLERDPLPAYKIVPPATGAEERWVEIQKEVSWWYRIVHTILVLTPALHADHTNTTVLCIRYPAQCFLHTRKLRIFHRSPG